MKFVMNPSDLAYARNQTLNHRTVQGFLDRLSEGATPRPELLNALYDMRDKYLDPNHLEEGITTQRREEASKAFLNAAIFIFAGLYSRNGERVPGGLLDTLAGLLPGCEEDESKARASHVIFCSPGGISHDWIEEFEGRTYDFCLHAIGPLYALAKAFVVAQEEEAAEEANRQSALAWEGEVSPSVLESLGEALGETSDDEDEVAE